MPDRIQDYVDRPRRYHNIDGMGEIECGVMALWSVLLVNVLQAIPKESFWGSAYAAPLLWVPFIAALELGGRAVIEYSLEELASLRSVRQLIVAVSDGARPLLAVSLRGNAPEAAVVRGGARRQDSVRNALKAVDPRADVVLIHDAARPFFGRALARSVIRAAARSGACVCAVPVKATIKEVAGGGKRLSVRRTLDRKELWEVQTPQAFSAKLISRAYRGAGKTVTDDASLVERMGHRVAVVPGAYSNIKITTPDDLVIAEALLRQAAKR
jgi:2-C-methyl-D-erythritol 4-phosphate cytidylyltransferase